MRSTRAVLAFVLFVTACADGPSGPDVQPVSTTATSAPEAPVATAAPETTAAPVETTTPTASAPALAGLAYETVATANFPMALVPDDVGARDLVLTRAGRVSDLSTGEVVLDISSKTRTDGERGLLSGLVGPSELDDALFVHYSDSDGNTVVSRFERQGAGFDPESEQVLFRQTQPAGNHNGGGLQLADGRLYLGLGDGGGANDQFGQGQDFDTFLGGIVEIDPLSGSAKLWAGGLRNPYRFWIDPVSATMAIADVGQNLLEEVDIVPLDDRFRNFGWPITEGFSCFSASECDMTGLTPPVLDIAHGDAGTCSITGGVTYRGAAIPEIAGQYFFSDYCGGWLRSVTVEEPHTISDWTDEVGVPGNVVGFGTDRSGEMYVLTTSEILKVIAER